MNQRETLIFQLPCPECQREGGRATGGEGTFAVAYCSHQQVFAVWYAGNLLLKACTVAEHAQQFEKDARAAFARLQRWAAEQPTQTVERH